MDPRQQEALVQRLIANPHDQSAIAEAHAAGQHNPEAYAKLLERVGLGTSEPALASHWLGEAANVWQTTFNDPARAADALLKAIDRDPGASVAYARLQQMYQSAQDEAGLTALIERRAAALATHSAQNPSLRGQAVALYNEVAKRCEKRDPTHSRVALGKALALEPNDALAIYTLREAHKAAGEYAQALPLFEAELRLEGDPERRKALCLDEADVAKRAGDVGRGYAALQRLVQEQPEDVVVKAQAASWLLEVFRAGMETTVESKQTAGRAFVELAEAYPGEHGLAYAMCALELIPGDDRAVQLAMYYAEQLQRLAEVAPLAAAYVATNPNGLLVTQARQVAGDAKPLLAPTPQVSKRASGAPASAAASSRAAAGAAAAPVETVDDLLERADQMAKKSRKNEAIATFRQVLELEPTNADALAYLSEQLPLKRKYAELKDVLLLAAGSPGCDPVDQVRWLREVAGLCENQLRDLDGAVGAWERIVHLEHDSDGAFDQLRRLLERAKRWEQLAGVLAKEVARTEDVEARIGIERSLARVHSEHLNDPVAAGQAWARIAGLSHGDDDALNEAVRLFESAQRPDLAADSIAEHVATLDDPAAKRDLYIKLGDLRAAQGRAREGGEALSEGAAELRDAAMWARAEHYFVHAQAWEQAANAADEQEKLASKSDEKAALLARAANYLLQVSDREEAVLRLERAVELAPTVDEYASALEQQLIAAGRVGELAALFLARADKLSDLAARVALRKRAAKLQRDHLNDVVAARTSYIMVLRDSADPETLLWLADDAEQRKDVDGAVGYLERLVKAATDPAEKVEHALREARLRARGLSDVDAGIKRLHFILKELDPKCEAAMTDVADLEQARGNYAEAALMLEQHFAITESEEIKLDVAARLAELYERRLNRDEDAIRVLTFIHQADPGDFDATQRLCGLAEENEKWELVAELMQELVTVEGDAEEVSRMNRRLAAVYSDKLSRGEDGLRVLADAGSRGDEACREAFIELGDRLGKPAEVAQRLVEWYRDVLPSDARTDAMHAAFERFVKSGSDSDAIVVAKDLGRSRSASPEIGETLEKIAVREKDLDALRLGHELLATDVSGDDRGHELVRQAEVLASLDVLPAEAILHGESALTSVEPEQAEPLLARLAALTGDATAKVDVYERQIARCKTPESRLSALCRAAEVAAEVDDIERAQSFFQLALSGSVSEEGLEQIIDVVRAMDKRRKVEGKESLRHVLAETLASGGQGARDGGKTRSRMLRRAANLAQFELSNTEQALTWIGDALTQYVETETLAALDEIAAAVGDYKVAETVASRALDEVFDGPMVRELLRYRAELREQRLNDLAAAAEDLRRLHDLNPSDFDVSSRLASMYDQLGDFRGMVKLHEDQIMRSRDQEHRAELARAVARLWQDKLKEPRDTADAWRRVLRLNAGDEEAKAGLARAKEAMLQGRDSTPAPLPPPVVGDAPETVALPTPPAMAMSATSPATEVSSVSKPAPLLESAEGDDETTMVPLDDGGEVLDAEALGAESDSEPPEAYEPADTFGDDGHDVDEDDVEDLELITAAPAEVASAPAASGWVSEEVALSEEPQPDPFAALAHEATEVEFEEAEVIDVELEPEESELDALVSSRAPSPPSRRHSNPPARGDSPKLPPPPPSLRKD